MRFSPTKLLHGLLYTAPVLLLTLVACGGSSAPLAAAYTVGGAVSGSRLADIVLQNNGGDDLVVSSTATTYVFNTPLVAGASYNVTIVSQPLLQTCAITGAASGIMPSHNVDNVNISC